MPRALQTSGRLAAAARLLFGAAILTLLVCPTVRALDPASIKAIAIDPTNPAKIWVSIAGLGVQQTDDGGLSWTGTGLGLPAEDIRALTAAGNPTVLFAGSASGIFRSLDSGRSWQPSSPAVPSRLLPV